jgi:uncharacterized membrane protein YuzA (DUF378 family)
VRILDALSRVLLIAGGLNWGLVGLFKFDLVAWICGGLDFGATTAANRIIYVLVGLAALYELVLLPSRFSDRASLGRDRRDLITR